ncbi:MAG: hypothetical protein KC910_22220 [Candidatus Eremiobacteraeota bacterium]|nr:hypothetical protein [Candidatus Eremiobacteraeota bacterium]
MLRLILIIFVGAGMLIFHGVSEYKLAKGVSTTPETISLQELEKGVPDNPYRTIEEHVPMGAGSIYYGDRDSDSIDYAYYPIFTDAEIGEAVEKLAPKHGGDTDQITYAEAFTVLTPHVIVKTKRWHTKAALGKAIDDDKFPTKLTGMVINKVDSLSGDERRLLKENFAKLNVDQCVIFEEGRKPSSSSYAFGVMAAGSLLGLLGLGVSASALRG